MSNSECVSRKAEDAYPTDAPGTCSQFLVGSELLICFFDFVCKIIITVCSLLFLEVFDEEILRFILNVISNFVEVDKMILGFSFET